MQFAWRSPKSDHRASDNKIFHYETVIPSELFYELTQNLSMILEKGDW